MSTKSKGKDVSDRVLGQGMRPVNAGVTSIPVNSHHATGDFYVDRSRIAVEDKCDWNAPGGEYRQYQEPKSIMNNARASMGGLTATSSFHDESNEGRRVRAERMARIIDRGDD